MVAIFSDSGFTSFAIPALFGPWVSLKAGLIGEPYVYIRLLAKFFEFLTKCLSLRLILAIGPGLRNLKGEALLMKKTHHGLITTLDLIAL
jgi:hypothetical protein